MYAVTEEMSGLVWTGAILIFFFSRYGQPFLLNEPSFQKEVILPAEHIKWFSDQPDSILSSAEIHKERHAARYLRIGVDFDTTVFFLERFIKESITKNLDKLQKPLYEEVRRNVDVVFGSDENQWKTLNVYGSLQDVIVPAISRVCFGRALSRDPHFVKLFQRYILAVGVGTIVIGQLPRTFKVLVTPILNIPLRYYRARTMKALIPLLERQLEDIRSGRTKVHDQDYDLISQSARFSMKLDSIRNIADPKALAEWIMIQAYETLRGEAAGLLRYDNDWNNPQIFKNFMAYVYQMIHIFPEKLGLEYLSSAFTWMNGFILTPISMIRSDGLECEKIVRMPI
ncbi:MAG: hypothetical protein Q9212_002682 [Teloschistes hypoglaucus]